EVAALLGHADSVARISEHNTWIGRDSLGAALKAAVSGAQMPTARLLLEKGADVDARDRVGETPLHAASRRGRADFAALLIDKGASINAVGRLGTPLDLALETGTEAVAALLVARGGRRASEEEKRSSEAEWQRRFDTRFAARRSCSDATGRRG